MDDLSILNKKDGGGGGVQSVHQRDCFVWIKVKSENIWIWKMYKKLFFSSMKLQKNALKIHFRIKKNNETSIKPHETSHAFSGERNLSVILREVIQKMYILHCK